MWVGSDSRYLARCTVRRPFRTALDLCTGSGIHALLAAAHTQRVLAVDINPRAASCTRFNSHVLGISNLNVEVGDLYEPARGEQFDLITANPPFVPSPLDDLLFRDGGRSGEDIQKRIIAGLRHHLAPGGIAQVITKFGERDGEPLVQRIREWLDGATMDVHVLRLGEHTAMKYAVGHAQGDDYETFLGSIAQWARNLRAQGYVRIVSLVISFRWSRTPPRSHHGTASTTSPPPRQTAGTEIEAAFRAERLTRQLNWPELLQQSSLMRAGSIALLDAQVLGSDLRAKSKATLLGQALKIEHLLDPLEREILTRIRGCTSMAELDSGNCTNF